MVKLYSSDLSWNNTYLAMSYHFLTQPLPSIYGRLLHINLSKIPWHPAAVALTISTLVVEVIVPLVQIISNHRIVNYIVALIYIILQISIAITGYFGKLISYDILYIIQIYLFNIYI